MEIKLGLATTLSYFHSRLYTEITDINMIAAYLVGKNTLANT